MARIVAVTTDLLFGSKVEGMLTAAGHEVIMVRSLGETPIDAKLIIVDLDLESPEELARIAIPLLGYYSHVDVGTREAAEAAGVDLVVPRSRMARELPDLAERLLSE